MSVAITGAVALETAAAEGGGLGVIDDVLDVRLCLQEREDRVDVFVAHVAKVSPRHDGIKLARTNAAGSQDFEELSTQCSH
jgi:hypothetical protein